MDKPDEQMKQVACEARDLLGALLANVAWMKSAIDRVPAAGLAEALRDMEICCERLETVLENALIGTGNESGSSRGDEQGSADKSRH
jgi:hypothetical protein